MMIWLSGLENTIDMEEIWADIEGYEGLYQISNLGRVWSIRKEIYRKVGLIGPYLSVSLTKDGHYDTFTIHRLVAKAFIPNPLDLPQVNHKDENPLNNCVDNLEWCDAKYNCNYGGRNSKIGDKSRGHRLTDEVKKRISEKKKGTPSPTKGIPHTEETKEKLSKLMKAKSVGKKVRCVETGRIFDSVRDAEEFMHPNEPRKKIKAKTNISMVCNGRSKTAYGYHWEFV